MVIFVVFLIAQLTILPDIPHDFAGMPETMVTVLVETGLPGVALTLTYGQLLSQLFVEEFTLPFLNGPGCYAVTWFGLALEYSGITHFSHLLYMIGAHFTCGAEKRAQKEIDSSSDLVPRTTSDGEPVARMEESKLSTLFFTLYFVITSNDIIMILLSEGNIIFLLVYSYMQHSQYTHINHYIIFFISFQLIDCSAFDYFRYAWSTVVCMASLGVVLAGIGQGYYILPIPVYACYFLFFLAMSILFYLEGIMIAIVATQYYDKESFKQTFPRAYAIHELVNRPDNVKRFIIGRQFFTVLTVFLIAGCTTFVDWPAGDINKALFWTLIKSGLVGVLVVLSFGQLMPELLAAEYPLRFMDMPGSYSIVWCSLFFDQCAVGHAAWAIYYGLRPFTCKKSMEEDSAAEEKPDVIREPSAELLAATGSPWGESPPPRAVPTV